LVLIFLENISTQKQHIQFILALVAIIFDLKVF
jgi:hypothetical protein